MKACNHTNAAALFVEQARIHADKLALVIPAMEGDRCLGEEQITYRDLFTKVAHYQQGWRQLGYRKGDRVILVLRPSVDMYAIVISMIALGIVPVFIDTGMSREKISMAIEDARARAIIGVRKMMRIFWLFKPLRSIQRFGIDGAGLGYADIREVMNQVPAAWQGVETIDCSESDHGLITFTSGSTGRPKGADRTHRLLLQQHLALSEHWPEQPGEVDCNCFPVMVLHNLCCGITTVMPRLDLAAPARVNPALIADQFARYGITRFSGAPAYMAAICEYAQENGLTFPLVRDVMTGGATVPMTTANAMHQVFPTAHMHVLYGSTEAEPIGSVDYDELVKYDGTQPGYLVGRPASFVEVVIARLDGSVTQESDLLSRRVSPGESGEICVSGPHVLTAYVDNPQATRENKIPRASGSVWHRTGDTGFFDDAGRLWLTGRVKDIITHAGRWIEPFPIEKCIDEVPGVTRSALLDDEGRCVLVLQAQDNVNLDSVVSLLHASGLDAIPIYRIKQMPVDGRHNSKIDRPLLRQRLVRGDLPLFGEPVTPREQKSRFIVTLNKVDMVTLTSVVTTCIAAACALEGYVYAAMSLLFLAMIADAMDGILARKLGLERNFGRYLDGFMDVLIYLVTPALVMYQWGFAGWYAPFIMLFIAAGCVRLAVFNDIGNVEDNGSLSYLGMPVFWSILILATVMLLSLVIPLFVAHTLLAVVLVVFSFLMVYRRPFFKFKSMKQILSVTLGGALFFALWQLGAVGEGSTFTRGFWIALYLNIPIIIGGVLHMIVVTRDMYPQLKIPIHTGLFGANKTWRGFVVVPLFTAAGTLLLYPLELFQRAVWGTSVLEQHSLFIVGIVTGLAYMVFELPNSYVKRRLGIGPGETPAKLRWVFILMDQLDSIIGVSLAYCLLLGFGVDMFFLIIAQGIFVALLVKRLLFMAKLKKAPA